MGLLLCVAAAFMAIAYSAVIKKKDVAIAEAVRALDVLDSQLGRHGFSQDFSEANLSSSLERKRRREARKARRKRAKKRNRKKINQKNLLLHHLLVRKPWKKLLSH